MIYQQSNIKAYYEALISKDPEFEGVFYVGVKTTGIFCRPTCPARKPKFENCEFFKTPQSALQASFRPCKRCQPLSLPNEVNPLVRKLVNAVEANPDKRWTDDDFKSLSTETSTVRRQFKKRFGMTFVQYARARRMGLAMEQIKKGESVIKSQLDFGYDSSSGFRDAFTHVMGSAPTKAEQNLLYATWLDTPLGPMIAIADEKELFLLEFENRKELNREYTRLRAKTRRPIVPGETVIISKLRTELDDYFSGSLDSFSIPIAAWGTDFQASVWKALRDIPLGETRSYADIAKAIGKPKAIRAVASANASNQVAIIIPCHRVINKNGGLGGYAGGLSRKSWLLDHEKENNDTKGKRKAIQATSLW